MPSDKDTFKGMSIVVTHPPSLSESLSTQIRKGQRRHGSQCHAYLRVTCRVFCPELGRFESQELKFCRKLERKAGERWFMEEIYMAGKMKIDGGRVELCHQVPPKERGTGVGGRGHSGETPGVIRGLVGPTWHLVSAQS